MITKNINIVARAGEQYVITIESDPERVVYTCRSSKPRRDEKNRFTLLRPGRVGPIKSLSYVELGEIFALQPGNSVGFTPGASASLGGRTGVMRRILTNITSIKYSKKAMQDGNITKAKFSSKHLLELPDEAFDFDTLDFSTDADGGLRISRVA